MDKFADLASFLAFARLENEMYGGVSAEDAWNAFVNTQRAFDRSKGEQLYDMLTKDHQ